MSNTIYIHNALVTGIYTSGEFVFVKIDDDVTLTFSSYANYVRWCDSLTKQQASADFTEKEPA